MTIVWIVAGIVLGFVVSKLFFRKNPKIDSQVEGVIKKVS